MFPRLSKTLLLSVAIFSSCWLSGAPAWTVTSTAKVFPSTGPYSPTKVEYRWTLQYSGGSYTFPGYSSETSSYIPYPGGTPIPDLKFGYTATTPDKKFVLIANAGVGNVYGVGEIYPKYKVLTIKYAPPGTTVPGTAGPNIVDYGQTSVLGTSTTLAQSFSGTTSIGITSGVDFKFGGFDFSGEEKWTNAIENSSTISINKSTSYAQMLRAPMADGIDHDQDLIVLWLNPQINFRASADNSCLYFDAIDSRDPNFSGEMDTVEVSVKWLKNPSLMKTEAPTTYARLQRAWAGASAGLNSTDYSTILGTHPLWNCSTDFSMNGHQHIESINAQPATAHRFQQIRDIDYTPLTSGGGGPGVSYAMNYQNASQQDTTAKTSYSVSCQINASANFFVKTHLKSATSMTWEDRTTRSKTNISGQSASATIWGPKTGWTGPVTLRIYRDNLYGTFVFAYVE